MFDVTQIHVFSIPGITSDDVYVERLSGLRVFQIFKYMVALMLMLHEDVSRWTPLSVWSEPLVSGP